MDDRDIRRYKRAIRANLRHRKFRRFHPRQQGRHPLPRTRRRRVRARRGRRRPAPHPRRQARPHRGTLHRLQGHRPHRPRHQDRRNCLRRFPLPPPRHLCGKTRHHPCGFPPKLLEDNTALVADGGETPAQLAAKAALRAKFIAYELPADFVEDLRADRNALDACNTGKISDNLEGIESTSAIETLLTTAQGIVSRLDAAIQNKYTRNPGKLVAWKSASHTERAPKKQKPDDTTPPPVA